MSVFRIDAKFWLAAILFSAACADHAPLGPLSEPLPAAPTTQAPSDAMLLQCSASAGAKTFSCAPVRPAGAANADYIVGGQGVYVKLTSTNVSYNSTTGILGADVTVQNLLPDALGTIDGTTLSASGVKVFFESEPTVTSGTGTVSIQNADGTGTFTNTDQSYFQYNQLLAPNATSSAKRWNFQASPDITFSFTVLVSAPVQARLVISEIMANPSNVADDHGEWFEVYNAGRTDVDLTGWMIKSGGATAQSHTIAPSATTCGAVGCTVIVPRGGYVVLSNNRDPTTNGGVPVDYQYPDGTTASTINIGNTSATEYLAMASPAGVEVDRVTFGTSSVVHAAASSCLVDVTLDNSVMSNTASWQYSTALWSGSTVDKGTPKAANSGCGSAPPAGPITTVAVSPASASVAVGATRQYTATGHDANGVAASTTFTWTIDDTGIATVNASSGLVLGVGAGTTTLHATSANGIVGSATVQVTQEFTSAVYRNHLEFGIPSDGNAADEIYINRAQYSLSYSQVHGGPNWVSWNLNKTHFGAAERCDCFAADPLLPVGVTPVVTSDYTGSGYSRGHMVMSEQRTATDADNQATFYMTNVLPQYQDLNGGPWLRFETYNNDLARLSNKELYIISGGVFSATPATLNNAGKVQIPTTTWKIVVVLDSGQTLANVTSTSSLQVIAVNMPNVLGISGQPWQNYITTVDAIEAATGFDFLANLPDAIESVVESSAYVPATARIPGILTPVSQSAIPKTASATRLGAARVQRAP
jgi:DNA/RNA endonuclease G (NUC1)